MRPVSIFFRKSVVISLSTLLLAGTMWVFGHKQLGGFDMSALVDTGWRMANSQVPYVDFPLTTPVAFYIGAGWALQLFGIKWSAFVSIAIIFAVASYLIQLYLLSQIMEWKPALAISLVSQLLCSVVISYWWYNAITMNAVCVFLSAAYLFVHKPGEKKSSISLWLTLTLLSLMKPNVAGGLAVLVFLALFIASPYRFRLIWIGIAGLLSFVVILYLLGISPLDVIQSYVTIGRGRAVPSIRWFYNDKPYEHLVVIPLIVLSLLPFLERLSRLESERMSASMWAGFWVTLASITMGILSLLTNSDTNLMVGVPFFLISSFCFYFLTSSDLSLPPPRALWTYVAFLCMLFSLRGLVIYQSNFHAKEIAPDFLNFWFIFALASGVFSLFLLIHARSEKDPIPNTWAREKILWATLIISAGISFLAGGMRWRVSYIGYESFFTYSPLVTIDQMHFFENFMISPSAKSMLLDAQSVLIEEYGNDEKNWGHAHVYFGPRIEFAYAVFGINSPVNLPIWWHPNNSYPPELEAQYVQAFIDYGFENAIFMKKPGGKDPEFGFLPESIISELETNYNRTDYYNIVVFHIK
jgi:hypothetical protein